MRLCPDARGFLFPRVICDRGTLSTLCFSPCCFVQADDARLGSLPFFGASDGAFSGIFGARRRHFFRNVIFFLQCAGLASYALISPLPGADLCSDDAPRIRATIALALEAATTNGKLGFQSPAWPFGDAAKKTRRATGGEQFSALLRPTRSVHAPTCVSTKTRISGERHHNEEERRQQQRPKGKCTASACAVRVVFRFHELFRLAL
jgi:hypothetical protein